jgi:hypothetical protein
MLAIPRSRRYPGVGYLDLPSISIHTRRDIRSTKAVCGTDEQRNLIVLVKNNNTGLTLLDERVITAHEGAGLLSVPYRLLARRSLGDRRRYASGR